MLEYLRRYISIHALRGEGDIVREKYDGIRADISIHALRGEGDKLQKIFDN